MSAAPTPGGLFIELDQEDEWPKIGANTWDALEFDACHCTVCNDLIAGWLYESDDGYGSGGRWNTTFMDAGLRLYCESCAYDLEQMTLEEWVDTFEPWLTEADTGLPPADYWHNARGPAVTIDPPAVAGVDYEIGCCDICGRTEKHDHTYEEIGEFDWDEDRPRQ